MKSWTQKPVSKEGSSSELAKDRVGSWITTNTFLEQQISSLSRRRRHWGHNVDVVGEVRMEQKCYYFAMADLA